MIIFGCSDIGPAKYIAELQENFPDSYVVASKLNRSLFNISKCIAFANLEDLKPNLIVTGTSLNNLDDNIDKKLLIWANQNGVPSISIIEHWSWYIKRFQCRGSLLLPNYIILNDQNAFEQAIKEGLPSNRLRTLGNPYLERILTINNEDKDTNGIKHSYNFPIGKKLIFFISEELKNDFPSNSNDYLGYDEFMVLEILKSTISPNDHLVVKLHPEECRTKYIHQVSERISIVESFPLGEMVKIADKIIGMGSMLLLEASLHRNDVISFRPNASKKFIGNTLGVLTEINREKELIPALRFGVKANNNSAMNFKGSKKRITNFLRSMLS